jgi:hypothetical protein
MKKILVPGILMALLGYSFAKLPPPDEATKAKAAETAAKAAWQAKVDSYLLCKAQDKVAAAYVKTSGKPMGDAAKAQVAATPNARPGPMPAAAQPGGAASATVATAPAATVATPAASAARTAASGAPAPAAAASGTPVITAAAGSTALPPCAEPGPFAYNAPEQKPLETSGAHSPSGTAASPPSVKPNSAEMAPAKK